MRDLCLYFQVHQPYRLRRFRLFDIGSGLEYFDADLNRTLVRRVAARCYEPANRLLGSLIDATDGRFRFALGLSGTLLEQLRAEAPAALDSFRSLVASGSVDLLAETSHHSLASLADLDEFETQVARHTATIRHEFGRRPTVFRNTELVFFDDLAPRIATLGFRAALVEGADHVLGWRSPNYVYESARVPGLKLLPRNYRLSDDVGFRFSNRSWDGWPLTADRYADWLAATPGDCINLFLDYETFGEHQWDETGIFEFLRHLPAACEARGLRFVHPSELADRPAVDELHFPRATSWADEDRDVTAWLGNRIQQTVHTRLYAAREAVLATGDPSRIETWRRLTTSDHFYYMCTKWFADGDVHRYFSPYETPYDAFITYANVLEDLEQAAALAPAAPATRPAFVRRASPVGLPEPLPLAAFPTVSAGLALERAAVPAGAGEAA